MAFYPSPAGATESLLPLSSWQQLVTENPALKRLEPDVEALLVNRVASARDYYIAPIDHCFELVGLFVRTGRDFPEARKPGARLTILRPAERARSTRWRRGKTMPDLEFRIAGVDPGARGLTPLLNFQLEITNSPANESIHP